MKVSFTSKNSKFERALKDRFASFLTEGEGAVDVIILDGKTKENALLKNTADILITDSQRAKVNLETVHVNSIVSCGMSDIDSVTFSSITEDTSVVCIRRNITCGNKTIEPCEYRYSFDFSLGIYQNLVIALIGILISESDKS